MANYTGLQYSDTSSTTLAGIKQDIYFLAHCSDASIKDGDLNRIINKYYAQLQEVVRQVNENFYMVEATADLISSEQSLTFPDGNGTAPAYEKLKEILVAVAPVNPAIPLDTEYEKVNCIDPTQISNPSYEFTEPTALMFGNYFTLLTNGTPTYPITDGVKIYYISDISKLVLDADIPNIFPSFHDAITQGALIDVAERLHNDQLKADSVALFKKRLEEIRSYASDRLPQENGLVEGQDNSGGWDYSFGTNNNYGY